MSPRTSSSTAQEPIRRYLDVRPHPTVVRLDDLGREGGGWITEAYHLTSEVKGHLDALRHVLSRDHGCGAFLIGQYGSGKSHFLAYLLDGLRHGRIAGEPLPGGGSPRAAGISLVNFRAGLRLEEIVSPALGLDPGAPDRRREWTALAAREPQGLVLVLDELSEFLRSKPSPAEFNEDIRFLQFMGEWSQSQRLWVVAAMQEGIEHTGELEYGMYRKIKDRYPLLLRLSPAHVKDLLRDSILIRKEGFAARVEALVGEMREAFPDMPVDLEDLRALYPIHPATLELLEEVRDRFSQARGVVDFAVSRLAGNPARGVAPFLDRPWGSLLTPETIVDHFQDILEVQPEFLPLAQKLFPHYRRHLEEIFPQKGRAELAWKLLKLLVLDHLAPRARGLTARDAACALLFKVTRVDPRKNLEVIEGVLHQLATDGRFVVERGDRYALDLEDDGGAALERFLERERAELRGRAEGLPELALALLPAAGFTPLALPREEWQERRVIWHCHERPYAVYFGNGTPGERGGTSLCVRLPWGSAPPVPGCLTIQPGPLEAGEEIAELVALSRARERSWLAPTQRKLAARFQEHLALFAASLRGAYLNATLVDPQGETHPAPRADPTRPFTAWLDACAEWLLRRLYPSFERFAPTHGPLPREAYRALMAFAATHDFCDRDAGELVARVREGYLVPMKLLARKEREYVLPRNVDGNEIVKLVLTMVQHEPPPARIYGRLGQPVYGLVPDQVSVLLVYLLILGEIDLLKGGKSYREAYETLPNPFHYDRAIPGCALRLEQLRELEILCEGLELRRPKQWTVLAQRRAAADLGEKARGRGERLEKLLARLEKEQQGGKLAREVQETLSRWRLLAGGGDALQNLRQFLFEAGPVRRFLSQAAEIDRLPERVDRLISELGRYRHLFAHWARETRKDEKLCREVESLGDPPGLEEPQALEIWLGAAARTHGEYKKLYARSHREWWEAASRHPIWSFAPPPLIRSRHLGLGEELAALESARAEAARLRCRGLVDLDYQPQCPCGFDGTASPLAPVLERFAAGAEKVECALAAFFGRDEVKARVRDWVNQGIEVRPGTLAYLEGKRHYPEVERVDLLDQHLSGLELVRELDGETLLEVLQGRTWEKEALIEEFRSWLDDQGAARLRVRARRHEGLAEVALWCLEKALAFGVSMPRGLSGRDLEEAAGNLRPAAVSEAALARLEELGLPEAAVDRVLHWVLDGQVKPPGRERASRSVTAALEVLTTSDPRGPRELARLSEALYREHTRMMRIAPQKWLVRLERLASAALAVDLPELPAALRERTASQWLVIDALGLPLLETAGRELAGTLSSWALEGVDFARLPAATTTEACYRGLVEAGLSHPLEKVNAIDEILHGRFLPFDDLCRLAAAELSLRLKAIRERLDPGRPLLVFADHGFRLARDGRSYEHGGSSTLEATVPLLKLVPATLRG